LRDTSRDSVKCFILSAPTLRVRRGPCPPSGTI
jgi:hypothetical protein